MGDDAALELEGGVGGVVRGRLVLGAALVDALGDVRRAEAGDRAHLAEEVVEHVAPVADHVEDHAAAVLGAVVPGRALRRLAPVALEHPVAEVALDRQHSAEEAEVAQHPQLLQAGQEELVLHDAVLDALRLASRQIFTASARFVAIGFSQ